MRPVLFALLVAVTALGCDGKRLTGPDAQRVVAQAQRAHLNFENAHLNSDSGPLISVDGVRFGSDSLPMRDLDPATIESVEIVKGTVAPSTYGPNSSRGVILITTKRFAARRPYR
jgi:outer membrane receptor protein involved in Fe transport